MAVVRKRRNPRRRRLVPRDLLVEQEVVDPTEETTDLTYRATETSAQPVNVRVVIRHQSPDEGQP